MTPMTSSPRIAIGMPVYNGEAYLAEAIKSILAQTFQDFEVIIFIMHPPIGQRRFVALTHLKINVSITTETTEFRSGHKL